MEEELPDEQIMGDVDEKIMGVIMGVLYVCMRARVRVANYSRNVYFWL